MPCCSMDDSYRRVQDSTLQPAGLAMDEPEVKRRERVWLREFLGKLARCNQCSRSQNNEGKKETK